MALVNLSERELQVLIMALETEQRAILHYHRGCATTGGDYEALELAEIIELRNRLRGA